MRTATKTQDPEFKEWLLESEKIVDSNKLFKIDDNIVAPSRKGHYYSATAKKIIMSINTLKAMKVGQSFYVEVDSTWFIKRLRDEVDKALPGTIIRTSYSRTETAGIRKKDTIIGVRIWKWGEAK